MKFKDFTRSRIFRDFAIIFFFLGLVTLLFNLTQLDITIQSYFYNNESGWFLKFKPFWDIFYRYGIFPGYLFGIAGLIMIALSLWNTKYIQYRRAAYLLVYTLVLGPGLIINLGLKDHWGRPRPFEIKEFGGKQNFLCVCVLGRSNEGKSFPCGHCSMGFFLMVPYLIYRHRNRRIALTFLVSGMIYGLLIGFSRMIAGWHFPSDVLWSGGLVWLVALTGVYIFKVDKPLEPGLINKVVEKKKARLVTMSLVILTLMITVGLILATPYISQKSVSIPQSRLVKEKTSVMLADLKDATVDMVPDTSLSFSYKINAFGFPNSKIRGKLSYGDTTRYQVQWMGWFTEVNNTFRITYPDQNQMKYILKLNKGSLYFTLSELSSASFDFSIRKGDLHLSLKSNDYLLSGDSTRVINKSGRMVHWINKGMQLIPDKSIVFKLGEGKLYIE